jgi:hypothetical protein
VAERVERADVRERRQLVAAQMRLGDEFFD